MYATLARSAAGTDEGDLLAAAVAAQGPRLRAFVRRQVDDLGEVDDIVQDALLELIAAHRLMKPIEHVAAWLQRVARNRIIDRFRQRRREVPIVDDESAAGVLAETIAEPGIGPDGHYARDALAERLVAAIDELPEEQRRVFVAHELDGRSFRELATETGVGVNTLLGRKHAAVRFLRKKLSGLQSRPGHAG